MPVKTITVLREYKLDVPWNWGSHEKKFEFTVEWDAEKTKLTRAWFEVSVHAYSGRTKFKMEFNGFEVVSFWWDFLQECTTREAEEEVTTWVANGRNVVKVAFWKEPYFPADAGGEITAILYLEFTGEEPSTGPPKEKVPSPFEKIMPYVPWIVGGAVAIGALYIIYQLMRPAPPAYYPPPYYPPPPPRR